MIPETTPKVKADEDLNSSVRWEPAVLFTVKQMGQGEGAYAARRDREGPLASPLASLQRGWPSKQILILLLHELLSEPELGPCER